MIIKIITSYILLIFLSFYFNLGTFVYALSPNDITNKVFFLDAQDTDNDWNSWNEPANNSQITNLIDKFNSNTWSQIIWSKQPIYKTNSINSYPSLNFDWVDDLLNLKDNLDISVGTGYTEKSYVMIIKTSDDVNSLQTIYDEGTKEKWFAIQIDNWHLYAWAFNTLDWTTTNKTIDLWVINQNEIYTIIFVYSDTWDFIKAYLNWELKWTLNSIEEQSTHWACTFETSFNCNIYSTGWALALWSTKNDILRISNSTTSEWLEKDFFKWNIWEISSYNHALSQTEVDWLNDYLFVKWWFDTIAPVVSSSNISTNQILPWWNHSIEFNYSDEVNWSWIDISSQNIVLEKWNWTSWVVNTSISNTSTTITKAIYSTSNLDFWKYRTTFNISDNIWNISSDYITTFYIDKPELIISTWSINIWTLNNTTNTFGDTITVTVKTIWAPFRVKLKKNQKLTTTNSDEIIYYNWNIWMGYDKNNDWNLFDYNNDIILSSVENINTNWNLNTYTYTLKMWAIKEYQQAAWDYSGKIDFGIELDY